MNAHESQHPSHTSHSTTAANRAGDVGESHGYAPATMRIFHYLLLAFVVLLLLSNIGAQKLVGIGPLVFDGGAILFPLTYVIGEILSEVYGFKAMRRAIYAGFVVSVFASLTFAAMIALPPLDGWGNQAEFSLILGQVPRFVAASLVGYFFGQLLNAFVLTRIKDRWGEKHLWARLVSSTVVGEFVDTAIFCLIAWVGVESWGTILNLLFVGVAYKIAVEVLLLPVTYAVINWVKRNEPGYGTVDSENEAK